MSYSKGFINLLKSYTLFSLGGLFSLLLYVKFWAVGYEESVLTYFILAFAGIALIFGQVRGVFFVKRNDLSPDIINALLGISVLIILILIYGGKSIYKIAFSFVIAAWISGIFSTILYRNGSYFLNEFKIRDIDNG